MKSVWENVHIRKWKIKTITKIWSGQDSLEQDTSYIHVLCRKYVLQEAKHQVSHVSQQPNSWIFLLFQGQYLYHGTQTDHNHSTTIPPSQGLKPPTLKPPGKKASPSKQSNELEERYIFYETTWNVYKLQKNVMLLNVWNSITKFILFFVMEFCMLQTLILVCLPTVFNLPLVEFEYYFVVMYCSIIQGVLGFLYLPLRKCYFYLMNTHGSHMDWKTWKNEKTFSSQGKIRELYPKYWKNEEILASFYFIFSLTF